MNNLKFNTEISFVKSLFLGHIIKDNIMPYPAVSPTEKETLSLVLESIDKFLMNKGELFKKFDELGEQPKEFINQLKELGLFGLIIPEEYGGIGLSNTGYSRVIQQISRYDASVSLTIGAHTSIGMKGLLLFGTQDQKKKYLSKLASGEMIASFCLTEPGSGSDAASIKTSAVQQSDGSWILNGEKLWITNAPFADFFTVFAKTDTPEGKITAFIVERSEGLTNGPKENKLGIRSSATSTVVFNNVKVPKENVIGEVGKGFKVAMAILNNGRTGLGGGCVGAMKHLIKLAVNQAKERKQFGKSISEYQLIKEKISMMTVHCFAAESVVNMVSHFIDSGGLDYSVEAAISKIFTTESLWMVVNEALQIAGGNGFMKEYPYEIMLRDSRINMIFEGTNEILRLFISLSSLHDVGEYLKDVQSGVSKALQDPIKGFGVLSQYVGKKVTEATQLGRDNFPVVALLKEEADILESYTVALSIQAEDIVKKLKKDIVGSQLVSKRFSDIAIDLFVGFSLLSRVSSLIEADGEESSQDIIKIAKIYIQQAKRRMNSNLRRFSRNEDNLITSLADNIIEKGGYNWDVL